MLCNDGWLANNAIFASQNAHVWNLDVAIGLLLPGTPQQFLRADLVDKAKVNAFGKSFECFNCIARTA